MNTIVNELQHEFQLVIENLERRPWIQREEQDGDAVCAHGAVMTCQGLKPGDERIIRAVMRAKGLTEKWNDKGGRTKVKVLHRFAEIAGVSDADLVLTFGPNWRQVIAVVRRAAVLTRDEAQQLDAARDAARQPARHPARGAAQRAACDAAWGAAPAAACNAARAAARAAVVADLVGQHGLTQHHIDILMKPWIEVLGPDWAEGMV